MIPATPVQDVQGVHEAIFPIVAWLITAAVTYVVGQLITAYEANRQKGPKTAPQQPPPNANGIVIPVAYGTVRIPPITVWFVDVVAQERRAQQTTLFGLVGFSVPAGYEYIVRCQQVLCWGPTDGVRNMVFGPFRDLSHQTPTQPTPIGAAPALSGTNADAFIAPYGASIEANHQGHVEVQLYLPYIYGPNAGVGGKLRFYCGTLQYGADTMLAALPGPPPFSTQAPFVPSYGDLVHVVYDKFTISGSATAIPAIDYIIYRPPRSLIPGVDDPAMNKRTYPGSNPDPMSTGAAGLDWHAWDVTPAAILYDALVNRQYGKGYRESDIDTQSFRDADAQLVDEGLGMSLLVTGNPTTFDTIKSECERTADMVLRRDPETFKWSVKLIRNEAATLTDFNAVPLFNETQIRELTWAWRDPRETFNEVTVTFSNAAQLYEQDSVTLRNDANIAMTGTIRALTAEYPGITDRALALKIAARELKAGGLALGHGTIKVTRAAWSLERGDCIRLSYPKYALVDRIVRVSDVDLGELTDNEITVGIIEDVFHFDDIVASGGADEEPPPPVVRTRNAPIVTSTEQSDDGATGTLAITVFDPDLTMESVSFRRQVGGSPAEAWDEVASGTPGEDDLAGDYSYDVALSSSGQSAIAYDVAYKQDYEAADASHLTGAVQFAQLPADPVLDSDDDSLVLDDDGHIVYA